jgi:hypothetical protein
MARAALEIPPFLPQLDGTLEERAPKVVQYVKARIKDRDQWIDEVFLEALLLAVVCLSFHEQDPASAVRSPWCKRLGAETITTIPLGAMFTRAYVCQ